MVTYCLGIIHPRLSPGGKTRFELGRVLITPGAATEIENEEINTALKRHQQGDWGNVDDLEKACNEEVVKLGGWLLSAYDANDGSSFLVMTRPDRTITTVMLPEEF